MQSSDRHGVCDGKREAATDQSLHMKQRQEKTKISGPLSEKGARKTAERDDSAPHPGSPRDERHAELLTDKEHECADFFAELIECLPELFR